MLMNKVIKYTLFFTLSIIIYRYFFKKPKKKVRFNEIINIRYI